MKYLRFGKIPKNGKSVNFLKLTNDQNEDFTYACEIGETEQAFAELPESAFEDGVSVFEMDESGMPRLDNLRLVSSMLSRIDYPLYEVEGDEVSRGNDGEPLISVLKAKESHIGREDLLLHAISVLCKSFKSSKFEGGVDGGSVRLGHFFVEEKTNVETGETVSIWQDVSGGVWVRKPPRTEYTVNGWVFSEPIDGFDVNLGIKG